MAYGWNPWWDAPPSEQTSRMGALLFNPGRGIMPAPMRRRRKRIQDRSTAEALRAVAGEEIAFEDGDASRPQVPRREALAYLLWAMALRGNLAACRLLLEYMDGKPGPAGAAQRTPDRPELTADELARAEEALEAWRKERASAGAGEQPAPAAPYGPGRG